MKIIDAQVHLWSQTITPPSGLHRKVQKFTADELLQEMDEAGVDAALIHPPRVQSCHVWNLQFSSVVRWPCGR